MENGTVRPNKKSFQWSKLFVQNPQYFDYDLLMILVFLMCFGLVMLYSTSAYSANADFGNDMFYFSKQAIISAVSFVFMLFVSKLDYHVWRFFLADLLYFLVFDAAGKNTAWSRSLWIKKMASASC